MVSKAQMHNNLRALILTMLNHRYIGGKHTSEANLVKSKIRRLNKKELKEFEEEYHRLINDQIIIRIKKRTGVCL